MTSSKAKLASLSLKLSPGIFVWLVAGDQGKRSKSLSLIFCNAAVKIANIACTCIIAKGGRSHSSRPLIEDDLKVDPAGHFYALSVYPFSLFCAKESYHTAYVVSQAYAAQSCKV